MTSLWDHVAARSISAATFHGRSDSVAINDLIDASLFQDDLDALRGKSVLLSTQDQLGTALGLLELDGLARRVVLCTPDLSPPQLAYAAATAECDSVVSDLPSTHASVSGLVAHALYPRPLPRKLQRHTTHETEWILLTSGTTGTPKLVAHTLESLGGTLPRNPPAGTRTVWSTFYDIRRYGGLQIYLRAVLSGSSLVLSSAGEPIQEFFARGAAAGVTHISGTPSHWRRALMSGVTGALKPNYVRLSGEIVDQTVLDNLKSAFPQASVGHAFASTEAGVAFEVNDGLEGFPAEFLEGRGGIDMKIEDGTLRIRSRRIAARYLDATATHLASADGFVDTGDLIEQREGRCYFRGRKTGVINVGGLKVHPEEVESVLNADVRVRMSLVRARRNPILGAVVVADVVLKQDSAATPDATDRITAELLESCRRSLPPHKVPSTLRIVPTLELTPAGKLVRPSA